MNILVSDDYALVRKGLIVILRQMDRTPGSVRPRVPAMSCG